VINDSVYGEALPAQDVLLVRAQQDRTTGIVDRWVARKGPQQTVELGHGSIVESFEVFTGSGM